MSYIKELIKLFLVDPLFCLKIIKCILYRNKQKFILLGTPGHGNLGDHAIALNELYFLKKNFPEKKIVEIITPFYNTCAPLLCRIIGKKDVILITGGGWMGDLWLHNEEIIRDIVKRFINNPIVIFPQTMYYSNDSTGEYVLKKTVEIFSDHPKVYLFVRENNSLKIGMEKFWFKGNSKVLFCPDMVLYGALENCCMETVEKSKIMVCLRTDRENISNSGELLRYIYNNYNNVEEFSTVVNHIIPIAFRKLYIKKLLKKINRAELVITDRLHAMLLSVMLGVPCVVLNNKTGKVFGVAQYLRACYPIIVIERLSEIDQAMKTSKSKINVKEIKKLRVKYNRLIEIIRGECING